MATTGPNVRKGEKPPVLSALGQRNSSAGAASFAEYWFRALDWGYATTDSTLAKTLYLSQCAECDRFVSIFDEAKSKRQHFQGGRIAPVGRRIILDDQRHPGSTVVDIVLNVDAIKLISSAGKTIEKDPASSGLRYRLWNSWNGHGWRLLDYKRVVAQ